VFLCPGDAALDGVLKQTHEIRPRRVVAIGRCEQAAGFVESKQVLVFKQDGDFPEFPGGRGGKFDGAVQLAPGCLSPCNVIRARSISLRIHSPNASYWRVRRRLSVNSRTSVFTRSSGTGTFASR